MTDRELLERAAKAADEWSDKEPLEHIMERWNPLTDDGDALRLAVKLRLCLGPNLDGDLAVVFGDGVHNLTEPYEPDPYAATRRAIVRAAAEMAKP